MTEISSFKEDDRKYKEFRLSVKDLEILSKHFNYQFTALSRLILIYDHKNNLLLAQVHEDYSTWELTTEEFEKLFKNK